MSGFNEGGLSVMSDLGSHAQEGLKLGTKYTPELVMQRRMLQTFDAVAASPTSVVGWAAKTFGWGDDPGVCPLGVIFAVARDASKRSGNATCGGWILECDQRGMSWRSDESQLTPGLNGVVV